MTFLVFNITLITDCEKFDIAILNHGKNNLVLVVLCINGQRATLGTLHKEL